MTTKQSISLACVTLFAGAALGASYSTWQQGSAVAEANYGVTLKIRQIPNRLPGSNDSPVFRCEVWSGRFLCKATILQYASFAPQRDKCSISILSQSRAIFHIDGYDIECTDYNIGSDTHSNATWKRLNQ
jgi:hypothetical protein